VTHLRRLVRAPGTYFVTSRTYNRRLIFAKEAPTRLFVDCLFHYRDEGHYLLHEFSAMPDHFHLLITPAPNVALERALQFIKGGSSHQIRKELGCKFPIWQTGFHDHRIRNAEDYRRHKEYILSNPARERLVRNPEGYPFGSGHPRYQNRLDSWPPRQPTSAAEAAQEGAPGSAALKRGPDKASRSREPRTTAPSLVGGK